MKRDKRRDKKHVCRICNKFGITQIHHIFYGQFRNKSEKLDLVIEVCPECHRKIHDNPKEFAQIKEVAQRTWEAEHSHEAWMNIFHRSWI